MLLRQLKLDVQQVRRHAPILPLLRPLASARISTDAAPLALWACARVGGGAAVVAAGIFFGRACCRCVGWVPALPSTVFLVFAMA